MLICVQLLSTPQGPVADDAPRCFDDAMLTIGRAPNCHVVLPDSLRIISRQHARIETRGAGLHLVCLSASAPVYVGEKVVPQGGAMALDGGERICIGGFELVLRVEGGPASSQSSAQTVVEHAPEPLLDLPLPLPLPRHAPEAAPASPVRGRLDQWFDLEPARPMGEPPAALPTRHVDHIEPAPADRAAAQTALAKMGMPDMVLPGDATSSSSRSPRAEPGGLITPAQAVRTPSAAAPQCLPDSFNEAIRNELMTAFMEGAGLAGRTVITNTRAVPAMQLTPGWMRHLGELLRASVEGALELLHSRSAVKREMRAEVTVIARRQNNPLKFAPDSAAALAHLIGTKRTPGFMEPVAALKDAHEDLLVHHLAVVAGMRAAMFELMSRFAPEAVMRDEGPPKGMATTIPALHEAALWRRYCQRQQELGARLDDDFEAVFGREFTKAYEAQARLVREKAPPEGTSG